MCDKKSSKQHEAGVGVAIVEDLQSYQDNWCPHCHQFGHKTKRSACCPCNGKYIGSHQEDGDAQDFLDALSWEDSNNDLATVKNSCKWTKR